MSESYKRAASAEGWWRIGEGAPHKLVEIQLFFYEGRFSGSGVDTYGAFVLKGKWL